MTPPLSSFLRLTACALGLCAADALAQSVVFESLNTKWTHVLASPNWTDNVPLAKSDFGSVAQLNSAPLLDYASAPITTLQPGYYTATCRIAKITDQTGAEPITLRATLGAQSFAATLPVASQKTDAFVLVPSVIFQVTATSPSVTFKLSAFQSGTVPIQNYQFDSFVIGQIPAPGSALIVDSLSRTFGHAWTNSIYYVDEFLDPQATFGVVSKLVNVWWLEFGSPDYYLQPGTYVANARLMKSLNSSNTVPLDLEVDVGGNKSSVTLLPASQIVGTYVLTPDLVFTVTQPSTKVKFRLHNILSTYKTDYHFDALFVRVVGEASAYGQGCAGSLGVPALAGQAPRIGEVTPWTLNKMKGPGVVVVGLTQQSIDLTVIGMPGCTLLTDVLLNLPVAPNAQGVATLNLALPFDLSLLGGVFLNQGAVFDAQANRTGLVVSNAIKATIGN